MTFPGFDHTYYAEDPGTPGFTVDVSLSLSEAFSTLRGDSVPKAPVAARWVMGRRKPQDFIWTTLAVPFIVSPKVISLFRERSFTGWSTYPVDVVGASDEQIGGYCGLAVHGRCGPFQPERSAPIQKPGPTGLVIEVYKGMFFDERAWDGSDVFMPSDKTGLVFLVQAVRDAVRKSKLTGITLDRCETHERMLR